MNDPKPFKHGEEGTHSVCAKHNIGGKSVCCECSGKTDCSHVMTATPSQVEAIANWILNGEVGESSRTIAGVLLGGGAIDPRHPYDPDDFKRCYALVELIPTGKELFRYMMRGVSPNWKVLVEHWDELCALWVEERNSPSRCATKLYKRMKELAVPENRENTIHIEL